MPIEDVEGSCGDAADGDGGDGGDDGGDGDDDGDGGDDDDGDGDDDGGDNLIKDVQFLPGGELLVADGAGETAQMEHLVHGGDGNK